VTEPIAQTGKPTSTSRTRAFRERRRRGVRMVQIRIKEAEIEALERLGYLEPGLREDAVVGGMPELCTYRCEACGHVETLEAQPNERQPKQRW